MNFLIFKEILLEALKSLVKTSPILVVCLGVLGVFYTDFRNTARDEREERKALYEARIAEAYEYGKLVATDLETREDIEQELRMLSASIAELRKEIKELKD